MAFTNRTKELISTRNNVLTQEQREKLERSKTKDSVKDIVEKGNK